MPYREPVTKRVVYWLGESGSGFKPRSLHGYQDIQKIKATCHEHGGVLFEDEEFPANTTSLGTEDAKDYIWKRPFQIVPRGSAPEFIVDDADRFDIRQGNIGNCWLLAAIADLTLNPTYLKFTLTTDNSFTKKYCGAFHFRFWQYGKWIDVTVDDRLPCRKDGTLAFMHSEDKNEFWGPLLEKAFAKLNGSYKALEGGFTFQGLQDFTGGFTEIFILSMPELEKMKLAKTASDVFDLMVSSQRRKGFMGSSVKAHTNKREKKLANGLVQGHAYSITDLKRVPIKDGSGRCIELVRLRNPWGNAIEWNGDFSDNSPCWDKYFEPEIRTELGVTYRADGEFWMTVTDYLEQFDRIEVCNVLQFEQQDGADTTHNKDMTVQNKLGQWTRGVTAGGPMVINDGALNPKYETNPQYLLTVKSEAKTLNFVCLMKNERKAEGKSDVKKFSFDVFDVSNIKPKSLPIPLNSAFFEENEPLDKYHPPGGPREVTCRFQLGKGRYVIVPHTTTPQCGGNYLLRVFSIKGDTILVPFDKSLHYEGDKVEIKENSPETQEEIKKYKEFFYEVGEEDGQVDWWELKMLLDKTFHQQFHFEGFGFSEDECRAMVALYDGDCSGKLEFYEFMKLWLNIKKWKGVFDKFAETQVGGTSSVRTPKLGLAFAEAGYSVSKDVLSRIVLRYGDRSGMLWLGKFIVASVKLEAVFEEFRKMDVDNAMHTQVSFDTWLTSTMYS